MIIVELIFPVLPVFHLVLLFNSWKQLLYRFCLFLHDTHYSVLKGSKCQRHSVFFLSSNTVILQEIICRKYTEIFIMLCAQSNSLQLLLMFLNLKQPMLCMGFPGVIVVKNLSANEGDI